MKYLFGIFSYLGVKLNMPTISREFLKRSLTYNIGQREPGLSWYLRNSSHVTLIELLDKLNVSDDYRAYLKALVYRHEKNYTYAYKQIENNNQASFHALKIRLLYDMKNISGIIELSKKQVDVLKPLSEAQQATLIRYLISRNYINEAESIINFSEVNNAELIEEFEEAKEDIFYKYTWTNYTSNILKIDNHHDYTLLELKTYIDEQENQFKNLGYVLAINEFFMKYEDIINDEFVPYINSQMGLYQYLDPVALHSLNFDLNPDEDKSYELQNLLNYYQMGRQSDVFLDKIFELLPQMKITHQQIMSLRRMVIDGHINLNDKRFIKMIKKTQNLEIIFYNLNLFLDEDINEEVDKFVHTHFRTRNKKRLYDFILKQLLTVHKSFTLPEYLLNYIEETQEKKLNHAIIYCKYLYNTDNLKKMDDVVYQKSKDKQLKIRIKLSTYLFYLKEYHQALMESEKAYQIKQLHPAVLRALVRNHHVLGGITERYEFLSLLKKHYSTRVFPGEFQMAEQEYELFHENWELPESIDLISDYAGDEDKILFVLNKSLPAINGYTIRSNEIIKRVKSFGKDPVITTRLGWSPKHEGYEIPHESTRDIRTYYIDKSDQFLTSRTPLIKYFTEYADELYKIILKERPSIIHTASNFQNALPSLLLGKELNIHTLYELRGMWHHTQSSKIKGFQGSDRFNLQENYEVYCCNIADEVICISESLKEYMIEKGIDEKKITVLPNGVDSNTISPVKKDEGLIEQFNLENHTVLGFIGSLTNYEGLELVLEAMKALNHNENTVQKYKFLIVGDGQYRSELEARAVELGIIDDVIFTGKVPHAEVSKYYSVIDIAPFPRKNELVCQLVTPIKTYEAMAMAKPVIVSDVEALKEMVIDGVNGTYFEADNVEKLKEAIQAVSTNNSLGSNAREWVIKKRDWNVLLEKLMDQYKKIK